MKFLVRMLGWSAAAALAALLALAAVALQALAPRPGEWHMVFRLGPWQREASVPTLLRWATHPLVLPLLHGRTLGLAGERWRLTHRSGSPLEAACAPCDVRLAALGGAPLRVSSVQLALTPRGADRFDGTLRLGEGAQALVLPWRAVLDAHGLQLHAVLAATPIAHAVALLAADVPEAARARVDGTLALELDVTVRGEGLRLTRIAPRMSEVAVAGLGTEALLDADPSRRCRPQPPGGRVEGWIQNAVMAAEDAHFTEHPGYEIANSVKAWNSNQQQPAALQGASTITQQLAKIVYTGGQRSAARKLREWLYAVELERTLGKGRILQLYLALLPWGDGVCGAEAAARHHLGKPVNRLRPHEAAWLASLLVNPDLQLRRWAQDDATARERALAVLRGMRRLPRERREHEIEALERWQPPIGRSVPLPPQPSARRVVPAATSDP